MASHSDFVTGGRPFGVQARPPFRSHLFAWWRCNAAMRIYLYASSRDRNLLGVTEDESGGNLPGQYAPWHLSSDGPGIWPPWS
jgi:hypothetical protein